MIPYQKNRFIVFLFCFQLLLFISLNAQQPAGNNIINGFIQEDANGETLNYANVYLEGTSLGDMSNEHGYYVIDGIPDGEYLIKVMMIGYIIEEK